MTALNGRDAAIALEGPELDGDARSRALLLLGELADDIDAGLLSEGDYDRARAALLDLRGSAVGGVSSSFRQRLLDYGVGGRVSVDDLLRALEEARPLRPVLWDDAPAPPRRWLVQGLLPAGRVALLTGEGGVGKSWLALQLASGVASGGQDGRWLSGPDRTLLLGDGVASAGAPVVFASWEDEPDEFRRRLHCVSGPAMPWVSPDRLSGLRFVNLAGEGPLWAPPGGRHISTMAELTTCGVRLRRLCERVGARLLVVDPLAAAYASDENARGLVRAFVSSWDAWGQAADCTVLILAHPPKSSGASYAGSTDWQGAVRALWTLQGDAPSSGAPPSARLEFVKGNYGPVPAAVRLMWDTAGGGLRWTGVGQAPLPDKGRYEVDR